MTPSGTPAVRPPPPFASRPRLGVPLAGRVCLLTPKGSSDFEAEAIVVPGRDPACDVVLDDPLSSRRHARIIALSTAVVIEDIGSTNGVYLNGVRLTDCARLHAGHRIIIGTSELSVFSPRRS